MSKIKCCISSSSFYLAIYGTYIPQTPTFKQCCKLDHLKKFIHEVHCPLATCLSAYRLYIHKFSTSYYFDCNQISLCIIAMSIRCESQVKLLIFKNIQIVLKRFYTKNTVPSISSLIRFETRHIVQTYFLLRLAVI